jgi:YVTN family beta-propeller protein
MKRHLFVTLFFLLFSFAHQSRAQSGLPLETVADIPLPGGVSRFDYQDLDGASGRLYIAHLGANRLTVFDTRNRRVISEVPGLMSVHGVIAVPELHRIYATATGTNELVVIDDETLRILARVPAGDYPNGLAYDARDAKIYVSNNRGGTESVIDARTNKALPAVQIGGGGGNTQYDPESNHILVTIHSVNDLAEIDPQVDKVVARYHLTGVENCHSLALDSPNRLAFVTCGGTAPKLAVFDLTAKKQMGLYPVGAHPDVLAFDRELGRLYVSSESGAVSVFDEEDHKLRKIGEAHLAPNAHSVAVDQKTHLVYFPLENLKGKPALRIMRPPDKAKMQHGNAESLRLVKRIPLPGVQGRIDHMAVDVQGQRLFVCALGNNTLEVVDLKKGERVRSVGGLREPQGVRYLPESNTIVVADRADGVTTFIDGTSYAKVATVKFSGDADNVRYDAANKQVYVGYGEGSLGVLSEKGERLFDIPLGSHPESFQLDSAGGKVYVNLPTQHKVAVVDVSKRAVTGSWAIAESDNYPMALDEARHRLFVVTRRPPRLLVYDTETGKPVTTIEAGRDSDDLFYDAARRRIYASFGEGTVMVYEQTDGDRYKVIARVPTAAGARTAFFSPELGQFYVAVPHRTNPTAEIRVYQPGP